MGTEAPRIPPSTAPRDEVAPLVLRARPLRPCAKMTKKLALSEFCALAQSARPPVRPSARPPVRPSARPLVRSSARSTSAQTSATLGSGFRGDSCGVDETTFTGPASTRKFAVPHFLPVPKPGFATGGCNRSVSSQGAHSRGDLVRAEVPEINGQGVQPRCRSIRTQTRMQGKYFDPPLEQETGTFFPG